MGMGMYPDLDPKITPDLRTGVESGAGSGGFAEYGC